MSISLNKIAVVIRLSDEHLPDLLVGLLLPPPADRLLDVARLCGLDRPLRVANVLMNIPIPPTLL
jgi:hypothetical protein